MMKRISDRTFGVLFCAWVFSAVMGMALMFGTCPAVIDPESVQLSANDPSRPPPSRSRALAGFMLGFAMVAWPLPFCRDDRSRSVDGFGRY
jgi:hypothetical protein